MQLVVTPFSAGNLEAVLSGEADAASNDLISPTLMQKSSRLPERLRTIDIGDRFDKKPFAMAIKKGSASEVVVLNEIIDDLKARGVFDELLDENVARVGAATAKAVY